jgi:hypothetical protein
MLIKVAAYTNAIEAHLARMRLEVEGVPAFVFHEHYTCLEWQISLALGGVKVYVHKNDLDHAKRIVLAHDSGDYALEDDKKIICAKCESDSIVKRRLSWKAAMLAVHFAYIPLYFRWATLKCLRCAHEWDLPRTNAYSVLTIFLAMSVIAAVSLALFFFGWCHQNLDYTSLFPINHGCGK